MSAKTNVAELNERKKKQMNGKRTMATTITPEQAERWASQQRKRYKRGLLSKYRAAELRKVGIIKAGEKPMVEPTVSARERRLRRKAIWLGMVLRKPRKPFYERWVHVHYYTVDPNTGTIRCLYPDLDDAEKDIEDAYDRQWAQPVK
jgi:hypothetical protein